MKSEIIAFACGRSGGVLGFKSNDCGLRGMLGGVASRFSSRNIHASATLPTPIALRARNRRRDQPSMPATKCDWDFIMIVREMDALEGNENSNSRKSRQSLSLRRPAVNRLAFKTCPSNQGASV